MLRPPGLVALTFLLSGASSAQVVPSGFVCEEVVRESFPLGFAFLPDDRVVLIERGGNVRLAAAGAPTSVVLFTIPGVSVGGERGLLGVAVDPDWPARPYFYFFYVALTGDTHVTMYTVSGDLTDPASTKLALGAPFDLLVFGSRNGFHMAGTLRFGKDGSLYVSVGDGRLSCLAQDLSCERGKILRLDVSRLPGAGPGPPPVADITPAGNPFPGPGSWEPLIYAWGLRNPFRFTIDAETGDLYLGDVGENRFEEVNLLEVPAGAGSNFGWPLYEGTAASNATCGLGNEVVDPVYAYPPSYGAAIIAGPLYRAGPRADMSLPVGYDGSYFFADYVHGFLRRIVRNGSGWEVAPPVPGQPSPDNWAEGVFPTDIQLGPDGAIYLAQGRSLWRIARAVRRRPMPSPDDWRADPGGARPTAVASPSLQLIPNPARADLQVRWQATLPVPTTIRIFDVSGRMIRTLLDRRVSAGNTVRWDRLDASGARVAAGTYFVRVQSGAAVQTRKAVLVRDR